MKNPSRQKPTRPQLPPGDITRILSEKQLQPPEIANKVFSLTYDELLRMAKSKFRRERTDHTLQPAGLVTEAFLRLAPRLPGKAEKVSRSYFFGAASRSMNQILVTHARRRGAKKRAGSWRHVSLEHAGLESATVPDSPDLDLAMAGLQAHSPRLYQVLFLRFRQGMSVAETAALLHLGESTVRKDSDDAKRWLRRELGSVR